jgi:hypothetical protein
MKISKTNSLFLFLALLLSACDGETGTYKYIRSRSYVATRREP